MAGVRLLDAGRRYAHAGQAELDLERTRDRVAVLRTDEIDGGVGRRSGFSKRDGGDADHHGKQQTSTER